MPGKNLSHQENNLKQLWENPPDNLERLYLRTIEIAPVPPIGHHQPHGQDDQAQESTGIRGIQALIIPFRFPITALCGNNGVGKSTVLALAALAHHSPAGCHVHWGNTGTRRSNQDRTYYTFGDFFVSGHGEPTINNVWVTWRYFKKDHEQSVTFAKTRNRWGQYSRREERQVDYLPLSRILPAYEMVGVRSSFINPTGNINTNPLSGEYIQRLSFIMGRQYTNAEIQERNKYTFQRCNAGSDYTAFNMGGGECCMIALLHLLERIERGGLLVVEEIEAGLHPQAQKRLAESLIEICQTKQVQIICSTHSEVFLDALPRQARLVLKKSGANHTVVESPSTRYAMYEMTGECFPELIIYCEDTFAGTLINESLSSDLRLRVKIQDVGSDSTVINQGVSHIRSGFLMNSLCVLDGDCTDSKVKRWIRSARGERKEIKPDYLFLPGDNLAPEKWVVAQLQQQDYRNAFAEQFNCTIQEAEDHIQALTVGLDHHDIGHILHQRTNLNETDCIQRTARAIALLHPQLDPLRKKVASWLD